MISALVACGHAPDVAPAASLPPVDPAFALIDALPEGAERCVVARPALVPSSRRGMVALASWAEPLAWEGDLPVVAYASAQAEWPDGRRARHSVFRFAEASEALHTRIGALSLRFDGDSCEGLACEHPRARWLDARTLEVSRRAWPPPRAPGVGAACARLARALPGAVEVGADDGRDPGLSFRPAAVPRLRERRLLVDAEGLTTRLDSLFRHPFEAVRHEGELRFRAEAEARQGLEGGIISLGRGRQRVDRRDARVLEVRHRAWEEIELALEDERLSRRAASHEIRRRAPMPIDEVAIERVEVVRHQVRLREAAFRRARGGERAQALEELVALLHRALEAHPNDLAIARRLVRLHLDEQRDVERAISLLEEVLTREALPEPELWRRWRREALAGVSTTRLGDALVQDGVASPVSAGALAETFAAYRRADVDYGWVESLHLLGRELFEASSGASVRVAAELPVGGLPGALVVLLRSGGGAGRGALFHVAMRVASAGEVQPSVAERPPLLRFEENQGARFVGVAAATSANELASLGAAWADARPVGPFTLIVEARHPDAPDQVERVEVRGVIAAGRARIERVSPSLSRLSWPRFARYLARPLAELRPTLFPPPELSLNAESVEVAEGLAGEFEAEGLALDCRVSGPVLRCSPRRGEDSETLLEALIHLAPRVRAPPDAL